MKRSQYELLISIAVESLPWVTLAAALTCLAIFASTAKGQEDCIQDCIRDCEPPASGIVWVDVAGVVDPIEHEECHGLNSKLRNKYGQAAVYTENGKAALLVEPVGLTLEQVAESVPQSDRGEVFDLYLVQQRRFWNDSPLYLLDEQGSYINGTLWHRKRSATAAAYSLARAVEMGRYVEVMTRLAERLRNYDARPLREFVAHQKTREQRLSAPGAVVDDVYVVVWYAKWCQPCKALEPHLKRLEQDGYKVIRVDVDNPLPGWRNKPKTVPYVFSARGSKGIRVLQGRSYETLKKELEDVGKDLDRRNPRGFLGDVRAGYLAPVCRMGQPDGPRGADYRAGVYRDQVVAQLDRQDRPAKRSQSCGHEQAV